jgi:hypothetical protein
MSRRQKGRPFVENWQTVAARIIQRVHRKAVANPSDERIKGFLEDLLAREFFFRQNSGERVGSFRVARILRRQP